MRPEYGDSAINKCNFANLIGALSPEFLGRGRRRAVKRLLYSAPPLAACPDTAMATAGLMASTMAVGIRIVAPRSLVVS